MFETRPDIRIRVRKSVIRIQSSETAFETVIRITAHKTESIVYNLLDSKIKIHQSIEICVRKWLSLLCDRHRKTQASGISYSSYMFFPSLNVIFP